MSAILIVIAMMAMAAGGYYWYSQIYLPGLEAGSDTNTGGGGGNTDGGNTDGGNTDGGNTDGGNTDGGNTDGGGGGAVDPPPPPPPDPKEECVKNYTTRLWRGTTRMICPYQYWNNTYSDNKPLGTGFSSLDAAAPCEGGDCDRCMVPYPGEYYAWEAPVYKNCAGKSQFYTNFAWGSGTTPGSGGNRVTWNTTDAAGITIGGLTLDHVLNNVQTKAQFDQTKASQITKFNAEIAKINAEIAELGTKKQYEAKTVANALGITNPDFSDSSLIVKGYGGVFGSANTYYQVRDWDANGWLSGWVGGQWQSNFAMVFRMNTYDTLSTKLNAKLTATTARKNSLANLQY